jgi:hypothetical protein
VTGVTATSRVSATMDIAAFKQDSLGEPTVAPGQFAPLRLPQSSRLEIVGIDCKYLPDIYCAPGCSV